MLLGLPPRTLEREVMSNKRLIDVRKVRESVMV